MFLSCRRIAPTFVRTAASAPTCASRHAGSAARCRRAGLSVAAGEVVVPFPAGRTADVMPRVIGEWLSRKWGQPVVVENGTGAAGNIGAEAVAKADPTATRCCPRRRRRW